MSEQDAQKQVRRARGWASGRLGKVTVWMNGRRFASVPLAVNDWPAVEVAVQVTPANFDRRAGSDDEGGKSVAKAANSPATRTARFACAGLAGDRNGKEDMPHAPSESGKAEAKVSELPAGTGEMLENRGAFVAAVHARVDLVAAWEKQVRSKDEKIVQRALEKLDEMGHERRGSQGEERLEVEIDVPPRD